jgi:hypothetical protein
MENGVGNRFITVYIMRPYGFAALHFMNQPLDLEHVQTEPHPPRSRRLYREIKIIRFRAKTLFTLYFFGFLSTIYPIAIIGGIPAVAGADSMKIGDVFIHGWKAFGTMIVFPPVAALAFALWALLFTWPGLWLFAKFRKTTIAFYIDLPDSPAISFH